MITKKDIGRPIELMVGAGRTAPSVGRIESVCHGIVTVVDNYIAGVRTPENGHYVCYIERTDRFVNIL